MLFGSDDGYAYCLKARTGELIWRRRGGPTAERLLGNGRMISRWPLRTGVLVADEVAYFAAGIFPHEEVYLLAVRAADGEVLWRSDTLSEQGAYRNDFSPQGYLLATPTRLFVPSGRDLPAAFDRATGALVFHREYGWRDERAGGVIGGTYALLADDQILTGTQEHLVALSQESGAPGFGWFPGRKLTVAGPMAYLATGQEILALDRSAYAQSSRRRNALEFRIRTLRASIPNATGEAKASQEQELKHREQELEEHRQKEIAPTVRWSQPSRCDAELVLCENLVVAGGDHEVVTWRRSDGAPAWSGRVAGRAGGLAIAGGRLYVSTDRGNIYCFAGEAPERVREVAPVLFSQPYPTDELSPVYAAAAEAILAQAKVTRGYCLVVGAEEGRLAWELARRTDLHVIGIERDPAKVRRGRAALAQAGLCGARVDLHEGDPSELPYSNYFANLIVSDRLLLSGELPCAPAALTRHLKPWGGVVCLGWPAGLGLAAQPAAARRLEQWIGELGLGRGQTGDAGGTWALVRRGALPGAGQWTHQYAEPGNTACSDDQRVSGSLGLLWFGEPGSAPMVNRHDAAAAPLARDGRLFIQGEEVVLAYDACNGLELWQRDIPGAKRTRLKARECGNLAVTADGLFVAAGGACLRLDPATGRTLATYPIPVTASQPLSWGYLACVDGVLYGSVAKALGVSETLFALDVHTGQTLWAWSGQNLVNLTIALGDGWVFFIDSTLTPEQRQQLLDQDKSRLRQLDGPAAVAAQQAAKSRDLRRAVALDARTGGLAWSRPVDVTDCSGIGIGGGELTAMYRDGILLLCGANANGHYWRQFLAGEFSQRRLVALSARDGSVVWARDADYRHRPVIMGDRVLAEPWLYDLRTGRQLTRAHPVTGLETPWQFLRPGHHCGAISASPQMLFMRSGYTSYYDLRQDSGIRHFAGHRLGCWINAIPANGLALIPEASAGCLCLHPINCTLVLEPRHDAVRWSIYSASGPYTPVQRLAVNLGAPGDRRDSQDQMWFAFPRPSLPGDRAALGLNLEVQVEFEEAGGYELVSSDEAGTVSADRPWLFASFGRGVRRCVLPLLGEGDAAAFYTVRLHLLAPPESQAGPARSALEIRLQGGRVVASLDISQAAGGPGRPFTREFRGVRVDRNLEIDMAPAGPLASSDAAARSAVLLCGLEVHREPVPQTAQVP
ncbi:MAG: hypothetical protein FJ387_02420 [Verrucomicrobia bacterium]|nr:hypothetical protein [Verrucomicrobiota bacterium]